MKQSVRPEGRTDLMLGFNGGNKFGFFKRDNSLSEETSTGHFIPTFNVGLMDGE